MFLRIVFVLLGLGLVFIAPWWVVLIMGAIGVVMFPWFLEIILLGVIIDALFGGFGAWYTWIFHTGIFTTVLLLGEFIKSKIHVS